MVSLAPSPRRRGKGSLPREEEHEKHCSGKGNTYILHVSWPHNCDKCDHPGKANTWARYIFFI